MSNFQQTLAETKANFSYDFNRKSEKVYARLKSIKRLNSNDRDIHGSLWNDRVILEVGTIDLDSKQCVVKNPNGMEWVTKMDNLTFCDSKGKRK